MAVGSSSVRRWKNIFDTKSLNVIRAASKTSFVEGNRRITVNQYSLLGTCSKLLGSSARSIAFRRPISRRNCSEFMESKHCPWLRQYSRSGASLTSAAKKRSCPFSWQKSGRVVLESCGFPSPSGHASSHVFEPT